MRKKSDGGSPTSWFAPFTVPFTQGINIGLDRGPMTVLVGGDVVATGSVVYAGFEGGPSKLARFVRPQ